MIDFPSIHLNSIPRQLNGMEVANVERQVLLMGVEQQVNAPLALPSLKVHKLTTRSAQATLNNVRTAGGGGRKIC